MDNNTWWWNRNQVLAEFIIYINMLTWLWSMGNLCSPAGRSLQKNQCFFKWTHRNQDGSEVDVLFKEIMPENVPWCILTKIKALDGISLKIESGKSLGIIGKVGSGKSSILHIINRLYDLNTGKILLDGYDIKNFKLEKLRSHIGNVPQNAFLFSESIEDNIRLGKVGATKKEIIAASKKAAIHKSIKKFKQGYQTLLGERGLTLSGGQIRGYQSQGHWSKIPKLLFDDCLSAVDTVSKKKS